MCAAATDLFPGFFPCFFALVSEAFGCFREGFKLFEECLSDCCFVCFRAALYAASPLFNFFGLAADFLEVCAERFGFFIHGSTLHVQCSRCQRLRVTLPAHNWTTWATQLTECGESDPVLAAQPRCQS